MSHHLHSLLKWVAHNRSIVGYRPGVTPLYKPYRFVPPQRVGFLRHFGLTTGMDFGHSGLEPGMVFEGTTAVNVFLTT